MPYRRNLLHPDFSIVIGAPHTPPGMADMCAQASAHRLWSRLDRNRKTRSTRDRAYGVGFALMMLSLRAMCL